MVDLDWLDTELPTVREIRQRLSLAIPESQDPQGWARRELAAKTVFVMLYGYAIEGFDRWIRPTAVTDMTDAQSRRLDPSVRKQWLDLVQGRHRPHPIEGRWYSENTRESIRDETLRSFAGCGVVVERSGLPTTSPKPRYALSRDFVALLTPSLTGQELERHVSRWQERHLSKTALARLALLRQGADARSESVLVELPNGEVRRLAPGPSSELTRAVVEQLTPRFLDNAALILLSESAHKLGYRDDEVSRSIGFEIDVSRTLPDVVLADLDADPPLLVFVECVVTDGPVNERRRKELEDLAAAGGFEPGDCTFVTAFRDRGQSPYRRVASSLAWGSFVWFESEPDHILFMRDGTESTTTSLSQLVRLGKP